MAKILINAINLRSGGGLQIIGGLLSRFTEEHNYEVLWNDPQTRERVMEIAGERPNISYASPCASPSNALAFAWLLSRFPDYVEKSGASLVFNINQHFPTGKVPQLVYHMNVLRFERPQRSIVSGGEIANRLRDWRAHLSLARSQCNVFESRFLADLAAKRVAKICGPEIIYIGLDDSKFRHEPSADFDDARIFAITSPAPHKDNNVLIDMLVRLCADRPQKNWRLTIAGGRNGIDSFPDVTAHARQCGVSEKIEWLGYCSHEELAELGRKSLCLVSTSRVESFCMVALEAMSWGCPVVVANATAMPESIGSAGLLATSGDPENFAENVLLLSEDLGLRSNLKTLGLRLSRKRSWSEAARQFESLFRSIESNSRL